MRCNAEFYYVGKIRRVGIGRPSLQRCVVLKWFYSLRAVGTTLLDLEVNVLWPIPSALLVNCIVKVRRGRSDNRRTSTFEARSKSMYSKKSIYVAHRRETSNALNASVYVANRNVFRDCLKLFPPITGFRKLSGREFQTDGRWPATQKARRL